MIKIELQDLLGDAIATVLIPQFEMSPEVLVWRGKIFIRISDHFYRETWWYHVLEPSLS